MINIIQANNVYNPDFHFDRKHRKSDLDLLGNSTSNMTRIMWSGDIVHISGGPKLMCTTTASSTWMIKNENCSGKLEKIRELVISGRYNVDADKLAEKMLDTMVCGWMAG